MFGWNSWKPFPDQKSGAPIEAPIGPGVFEVRRVSTGELVAFDHTASVARALLAIAAPTPRMRLFARQRIDAGDLEYRTCATASAMDAKSIAGRINSQRRLFWRQALPI